LNNPVTLRALYNVNNFTATHRGSKQASTAFLQEYFSMEDLKNFWNKYSPGLSGEVSTALSVSPTYIDSV
jgi:hypothetical protein